MKKLLILVGVVCVFSASVQAQLLLPSPEELAQKHAQFRATLAQLRYINFLQDQIARQEHKRLLLLHRFTPTSVQVRKVDARLATLRQMLNRELSKLAKPRPKVQLLSG